MNSGAGSSSDAESEGDPSPEIRAGSIPSPARSLGLPQSPSSPIGASSAARPARGWRRTFDSLRLRNFRLLWLSTVCMVSTYQMQAIAQGYLVYQLTGSAKILGLISASAAFPMLAFALVGGAYADRVERKRLVQVCQSASVSLALFVAVSLTAGTLRWQHLVVVALLQGVVFSFNGPARQALLPQLVERERLGNAIALMATGMSIPALVAPAVAGVLYAFVGPEGVYYTVTVVGTLAVVLTTAIHTTSRATSHKGTRVTADIREGLSYLWNYRQVRMLLIVGVGFLLLASPTGFLLPVFVVDVYHREAEALGLLVSMMGLGSLFGTLAIASLGGRRRGLIFMVASFTTGSTLLVMASLPFYAVAAGVLIVLGLGSGIQWALHQVLVMENVEDGYRGRVMSILMMNFGLMPLAVLPAGFAVDLVGPRLVVGFLAVALLVLASFVASTQRWLREMQ